MDSFLNLPKKDEDDGIPYLSYSQISTWKRSKREYIRQYFFGEKFEGNEYTEFGSLIGEALESNDFSGFSPRERTFLKKIPRYDEFERKVNLPMKGFKVIGYIDSSSEAKDYGTGEGIHVRRILDYKTGDYIKKISEYEDKKYTQLHLYAAAMRHEYGVLPDSAKVILIDRKGNAFQGEELKLGRDFSTIDKTLTDEVVDAVLADTQKVAEEISRYFTLFQEFKKAI